VSWRESGVDAYIVKPLEMGTRNVIHGADAPRHRARSCNHVERSTTEVDEDGEGVLHELALARSVAIDAPRE
jgi:hypothetical protein